MKKVFLLPIFLFLAGCSSITVLDPKSSTGKEQSFLIWFSFGIMALVVITVFVLFTWFVIKYRYTKEKDHVVPKDVKGNLKLELTWTILPVLLLAVLAVPTIAITYDQSPIKVTDASEGSDGIQVDVKAEQFKWTFTHENGKEVEDELVIPETDAVIFHLKSEDIIHSFWVPALAGKVDVFPDKELTYEIKDPEVGTYKGKCAEYCGIQHAEMTFDVKVVSEEDYKQYLEEEE